MVTPPSPCLLAKPLPSRGVFNLLIRWLALDAVQILVKAIEQKAQELLAVLLLVRLEAPLHMADHPLEPARRDRREGGAAPHAVDNLAKLDSELALETRGDGEGEQDQSELGPQKKGNRH